MKANELRIGNYYNQFGYTHQATGSTISELEKAPESQLWCKPIPLDESWLIRAGFIYHNPSDFYSKNWGRNGAEIVKKYPDGWMFELGKGYLRHFEYVHQLQNLFFALTGTELQFSEQ